MKRDLVIVVDLGTTKAVCLAAQRGEKQSVEAVAYSSTDIRGMKKGAVVDVSSVSAAIGEVVRKVENVLGESGSSIVVSIGGPNVEATIGQGYVEIFPNGRTVTRDDVFKVVNHSRRRSFPEGYEQIQSLPRAFKIDGQVVEGRPVGLPATRLEVGNYMVSGPTEQILRTEKAVSDAGLGLDSLVLQPLASGLGVITPADASKGVAVIDIGAGATNVAVFLDGTLAYHETIPVGSNHVSTDIAHLLKTSVEEADRLKIRYASAIAGTVSETDEIEVLQQGQANPRPMNRKVFCEIVESRMKEIANLCLKSIMQSQHRDLLGAGLLLTGGGSTMPGTDILFSEVFGGIRTRVMAPKIGGPIGKALSRPEMSSVIGLARFALDQEEDEFSTSDASGTWRDRIRTLWNLFGGK